MTLLLELVLITGIACSFAKLGQMSGSLLSALAVLLLLLPGTLWLFRHGIWMSFAIPLIAILLHKLIAEIEESVGTSH